VRKGAFALTMVVVLAGCAGGAPTSSPPTGSPAVVSSASPSASLAAAPWPSGDPVPQELAGLWYLGTSVFTMRLSGNNYVLTGTNGNVVVTANEIVFFNGTGCNMPLPGGIGRYSWTLSDTSLHFVRVADPCPRAELLSSSTWSRTKG
jgi:hypothetical protein